MRHSESPIVTRSQRDRDRMRLPSGAAEPQEPSALSVPLRRPETEVQNAAYRLACRLDGWPLSGTVGERYAVACSEMHGVRALLCRGNVDEDISKGGMDVLCRWEAGAELFDRLANQEGGLRHPWLTLAAIVLVVGSASCAGHAAVALALRSLQLPMDPQDEYVLVFDTGGDHGYFALRNPRYPAMALDPWGDNAAMLERHFSPSKTGDWNALRVKWQGSWREARELFAGLPDEIRFICRRHGRELADNAEAFRAQHFAESSMGAARILPNMAKYSDSFANETERRLQRFGSSTREALPPASQAGPSDAAGPDTNARVSGAQTSRTDNEIQARRMQELAVSAIRSGNTGRHAPRLTLEDAERVATPVLRLASRLNSSPQTNNPTRRQFHPADFQDPEPLLRRIQAFVDAPLDSLNRQR